MSGIADRESMLANLRDPCNALWDNDFLKFLEDDGDNVLATQVFCHVLNYRCFSILSPRPGTLMAVCAYASIFVGTEGTTWDRGRKSGLDQDYDKS